MTVEMRRLVLVIETLGPGGAERVLTTLANAWAARGEEIAIVTFAERSERSFYPLASAIAHIPLDLRGVSRTPIQAVFANLRRVLVLRRTFQHLRPDGIIVFGDRANVLALLAVFGLGIAVVASERIDPKRHQIGRVWNMLRFATYRYAHRIVVQSKDFRDFFSPKMRRRIVVIPNPVPRPPATHSGSAGPRVVGLGRLDPQKGFDLLIAAFARIASEHSDWRLVIHGDGPERGDLAALARSLGIADRVDLPGVTQDSAGALREGGIFVMSSRYEGFPNALCEALACGVPVVATNASPSVHDIVRPEIDGLVVPCEDVGALAEALDRLMSDAQLRARFSSRATEIVDRLPVDRVLAAWDALLPRAPRETAACVE